VKAIAASRWLLEADLAWSI